MAESIGLLASLKRLACTLLATAQTRLELLSNEIEAERLCIKQMLLYGSVALFFFGLAIMLVTVFIVVLFWDSHRLLVLGSLAALFFAIGILLWNVLCRVAREKSKLFSTSLSELAKDQDRLRPRP